jgi:hypothetical protein
LAASPASCPKRISSRHGKIGGGGSEEGSEFKTQQWNLAKRFLYRFWTRGKKTVATIGAGGQLNRDGKG